jgi:aldose 1-epimerase
MPDVIGELPDGTAIHALTLRGGGLCARVLTLGATVQDLRLEGVDFPLVVGSPDPLAYLGAMAYAGAVVGRFANRIGGAGFVLDGQTPHP